MRLPIWFLGGEVLLGTHKIEELMKEEIDWYAYLKIKPLDTKKQHIQI